MENKRIQNRYRLKLTVLVLADILLINIAYYAAIWMRYDFSYSSIPQQLMKAMLKVSPLITLLSLLVFAIFRMYKSIWLYLGSKEAAQMFIAGVISVALQIPVFYFAAPGIHVPISFFFIQTALLSIMLLIERFSYRFVRALEHVAAQGESTLNGTEPIRTLIVGAGEAGRSILREIEVSEHLHREVVGIIDDNPTKKGRYLNGVKIYGDRYEIERVAEELKVDEIIVAIPSAPEETKQDILNYCKNTNCELKILPGIYQLISGEIAFNKLRSVSIEDLLGREPVKVKLSEIKAYIEGKTVLVTGGGGTIGSELCRQIAEYKPARIIIFDIYENNAYDIQMELQNSYPELKLEVLIGSVRNELRLRKVFEKYRPDLIYHAAAHKHVPLMEVSPNEAIKNNVLGTLNTAKLAKEFGAKKFVLISTDKAVNPTSVMGATKRICEMIIQTMNKDSETDFVAVRFGNVLGSSGSVIPLFKKQIAAGGPVTVTHPDIVRYFMTVKEAVSLVLQAGYYAKGGEIFVLDMGKPMKILDLAKNLIRLSGYKVGQDIEIKFVGLRPGEKLYEEVLMDEEGLKETMNHRIKIGRPIEIDEKNFLQKLDELIEAAYSEEGGIRDKIADIVPTFKLSVNGIPEDYKKTSEA